MSDVGSAVAGTVADLFGDTAVAEDAPNSPDAAAPSAQDAAVSLPDLNPSIPEDLLEFLEEPDFDDDEPVATTTEDDEFVDPEELARENAKLRKRLEWAESQKAKAEQAKWHEEAKKIAPLSRPETINANSRRAFLREARKQHEENFTLLAPHIEAYKAAKESLKATVEAEIRSELADAWGRPNLGGGPSGAPVEAAAAADELDRARNSRNLASVAKALLKNDLI